MKTQDPDSFKKELALPRNLAKSHRRIVSV